MLSPRFLALTLAFAFAVPLSVSAADDVTLARVNGVEIKRSDVMRELSGLPPQLQSVPIDQIYPQLIERMIDAKLLVAEANKQNLKDSEDYKGRLARAEERILTDMVLRNKIKPQLTDAKVKERYDSIVKSATPEEEVRARHVLVSTEKEAKDIIEQLNKGGDIAKIAAEKSSDKGSAAEGGNLGYFTKRSMVKPFADAAFALKNGEYTKTPVKTDFGYHVIKVEDRRKSAPPPLDRTRSQIEAQMSEELANEYVEGLRKGQKIERFNLNGTPMSPTQGEPAPAAGSTEAPAPKAEEKKEDAKPAEAPAVAPAEKKEEKK